MLTRPLGSPGAQIAAIGFYPEVAGAQEDYVYRKPIAENDGWGTASLSDVGLDTNAIAKCVDLIRKGVPSPENPLNIHSLLIARHGKLVLEEYFYGTDGEHTHDMRSASKTFAPMLVRIAQDRDFKIGPDTPLYSLFPAYDPVSNSDERKKTIKLEDPMNMASGLAIDDADSASPGSEDHVQEQNDDPDWCRCTLNLPTVSDPGGNHPIYGSANINLVGCAVRTRPTPGYRSSSMNTSPAPCKSRFTT